MAKAGADIVVAHMGCTSGGTIGAKSVKTLESCVARIQAIVDASKKVRKDVICLCHGGPIAMPKDAQFIIDRVRGIDGFYGASSTERLPTEIAIKAQIEDFKKLRLPRKTAKAK
jgi:predicted TIM-barrel enzyme